MSFRIVSFCVASILATVAFAADKNVSSKPDSKSVSPTTSPTVTTDELKNAIEKKLPWTIIDVRTPEEYAGGHIPGAKNIPLDTLEKRMSEIPKTQTVILTCRSGRRSGLAQEILVKSAYSNTRNHLGGISQWNGPIAK